VLGNQARTLYGSPKGEQVDGLILWVGVGRELYVRSSVWVGQRWADNPRMCAVDPAVVDHDTSVGDWRRSPRR